VISVWPTPQRTDDSFSGAFVRIDAYPLDHHLSHYGAKEGMSDNPGEAA
jgi:hypothetical protein